MPPDMVAVHISAVFYVMKRGGSHRVLEQDGLWISLPIEIIFHFRPFIYKIEEVGKKLTEFVMIE